MKKINPFVVACIIIGMLLLVLGFFIGIIYQCDGDLLPNLDCVQMNKLDYCLIPDTETVMPIDSGAITINRSLFNWSEE